MMAARLWGARTGKRRRPAARGLALSIAPVGQSLALQKDPTRLGIAGAFAMALAGVVASGCGGGVADPSQNVTETFSSTVQVGSFNFNQVNAARAGEFTVTLISLIPPAAVFVAVSFGVVLGGSCSPIVQPNPLATAGHTVLSGQIRTPGTYCVQVADEGFLTVPETYTVQVSHP
jgi:hypothetical protein